MKYIDNWFAFSRKLGLGIEQTEEIILVTGCDCTRSWTNVALLGNYANAQVSFGVQAENPDTTITSNSHQNMLEVLYYAMGLKERYVCMLLETFNGSGTSLTPRCAH